MNASRPELTVTVFSDFICPFCYVGHRRLAKLGDDYDLNVHWRFLEIHPETPPAGGRFSDYGIPEGRRQVLEAALAEMAASEGLAFCARDRVSNSNKALRLAEAAKAEGDGVFSRLCEALFSAYFAEDQDIGAESVLRPLARAAGMSDAAVESAWTDDRYPQILAANLNAAIELGVTGTPTFLIGQARLTGAVPTETLRAAAREQSRQGDSRDF